MGGVGLGMISAMLLAAAAAFASATGRPWRGLAVRAAALPLVLTLGVLAIGYGGQGHPIHDVTTDLEDTLNFPPDVAAREEIPMTREEVLEIQRELYPGVQTLVLAQPKDVAYALALDVAGKMDDWAVTRTDAGEGRIEAEATSAIFHFVDDVVIRVEPDGEGSRVDMRSRSRMGRSDLGANSERIQAYLKKLGEAG